MNSLGSTIDQQAATDCRGATIRMRKNSAPYLALASSGLAVAFRADFQQFHARRHHRIPRVAMHTKHFKIDLERQTKMGDVKNSQRQIASRQFLQSS
jgi:hypothetical protein